MTQDHHTSGTEKPARVGRFLVGVAGAVVVLYAIVRLSTYLRRRSRAIESNVQLPLPSPASPSPSPASAVVPPSSGPLPSSPLPSGVQPVGFQPVAAAAAAAAPLPLPLPPPSVAPSPPPRVPTLVLPSRVSEAVVAVDSPRTPTSAASQLASAFCKVAVTPIEKVP
jgi:hypothetical protein